MIRYEREQLCNLKLERENKNRKTQSNFDFKEANIINLIDFHLQTIGV